MPRTAFILMIVMVCCGMVGAAATAGGDADAAVSMGLSARAQSLGDAGCGLWGDALSIFYNPASTAMLGPHRDRFTLSTPLQRHQRYGPAGDGGGVTAYPVHGRTGQ